MKILILGNGFDIAHGLPTQYRDFLKFADSVILMHYEDDSKRDRESIDINEYKSHLEEWNDTPAIMHIKGRLIELFQKRDVSPMGRTIGSMYKIVRVEPNIDKFYEHLKDNIWYQYIVEVYAINQAFGQNWVDFESEISAIIQTIDEEHTSLTQDVQNELFQLLEKNPHGAGQSKIGIFIKVVNEAYKSHKMGIVSDFIERLFRDLENLIFALEIYLTDFVETINTPTLPIIESIKPDYVISFNYTKTYERLYLNDVHSYKICHIHGVCRAPQAQDGNAKVDKVDRNDRNNKNANNMVLGIDEYLPEHQQKQKTDFAIFKKFVQRIRNHNDTAYVSWMEEIKKFGSHPQPENVIENDPIIKNNKNTSKKDFNSDVYIFGHSLDVTDKDILKRFIDSPYTRVHVYARSKGTEGELISHLLRYVDEETVIRKASMNPPMLEFKVTAAGIKSDDTKTASTTLAGDGASGA